MSGLKHHAESASEEIAAVAKANAPLAVALVKDWNDSLLTPDQAFRGLRKLELATETAIARIARDEARAAAKAALGNLISGALSILGAIF